MIPIQDLLARIRWDAAFSQAQFVLGYFDRLERRIVLVPFSEVRFPSEARGVFELYDQEGVCHTIPYHRVKSVYRDGELIWHRQH